MSIVVSGSTADDYLMEFASIPDQATGRASTLFNCARQSGAAADVAGLTTLIGLAGATRLTGGHLAANPGAYRVALVAAAACCLACLPFALAISNADAAATIPDRQRVTSRGTP